MGRVIGVLAIMSENIYIYISSISITFSLGLGCKKLVIMTHRLPITYKGWDNKVYL